MTGTDEDLVAGSLIKVFFIEATTIQTSLTGYRSIILRLEAKNGIKIKELKNSDVFKDNAIDEELRQGLLQWSDDIRDHVEKCQIMANSIKKNIKEIEINKIKPLYEKICNELTPDLEIVKDYVFSINEILAAATIDKTMKKMENFYEQFKQ